MTLDCNGDPVAIGDTVYWYNGYGPMGAVVRGISDGGSLDVVAPNGHRTFSLAINWSKRPTGDAERAETVRRLRERNRPEDEERERTE